MDIGTQNEQRVDCEVLTNSGQTLQCEVLTDSGQTLQCEVDREWTHCKNSSAYSDTDQTGGT